QRNRSRMIARRMRDHPSNSRGVRQRIHSVEGAPGFERPAHLEIFAFEIQRVPSDPVERRSAQNRGLADKRSDACPRFANLGQGQHSTPENTAEEKLTASNHVICNPSRPASEAGFSGTSHRRAAFERASSRKLW